MELVELIGGYPVVAYVAGRSQAVSVCHPHSASTYRVDTSAFVAPLIQMTSQTLPMGDDGMTAGAVGAPDIHDHPIATWAQDCGSAAEVARPLKAV
ncbi:hypothetical protein Psi02_04400 [Planotetraspora silvatica]|uniref:Uncharacterized protein n=1 Tax=Planotetraspora silvatica TaxID=234614 RepID=A0A8J3XLC1_9ACTN|nr:hypothetical protein Psi02_04400 [Planotetraspora silvatica]